jgi:hypothetical protein
VKEEEMKSNLSGVKLAAILSLLFSMIAVACSSPGSNTNTANKNAENRTVASAVKLPAEAKPMGATAPGFYSAGPNGNVSLSLLSPQDGKALEGNSLSPTFTITGYPIYKDPERNKGQHIHVILDNEPYEADYDPGQPFKPEGGKFDNLKEGTHTLRAFPSREWHESIKQEDGANFTFITFYVKAPTANLNIDKSKPLLTYSRPKGEYRWKEDPRGVMIDYYVSNAKIGSNDYKVRYTINGSRPFQVSRWEPIWLKWEEIPPGEYKIVMDLVDKNNKPVPFKVGNLDYNHTERTFKVLAEGEKPSAGH